MPYRKRAENPYTYMCGRFALAMGPCEPGDELGAYTRQELIRMDADFCAAMELAISRGLERSAPGLIVKPS